MKKKKKTRTRNQSHAHRHTKEEEKKKRKYTTRTLSHFILIVYYIYTFIAYGPPMVCSWCCFVLRLVSSLIFFVSSNLLRSSSSSSLSSSLLRSHFLLPFFFFSSSLSLSLSLIHSLPFLLCVLCKYSFAKLSSLTRATTRLRQRVAGWISASTFDEQVAFIHDNRPRCLSKLSRQFTLSLVRASSRGSLFSPLNGYVSAVRVHRYYRALTLVHLDYCLFISMCAQKRVPPFAYSCHSTRG